METTRPRSVSSDQGQHAHYTEELEQWGEIIRDQYTEDSPGDQLISWNGFFQPQDKGLERGQITTDLGKWILEHQERIQPNEKRNLLRLLSKAKRPYRFSLFTKLIPALLGQEKWQCWGMRDCIEVIRVLGTISQDVPDLETTCQVICPALKHLASLVGSDDHSRSSECIYLMSELSKISDHLRTIPETKLASLQNSICKLAAARPAILRHFGSLAEGGCLQGLSIENQQLLQGGIHKWLSSFHKTSTPVQECVKVLQNLSSLARRGFLKDFPGLQTGDFQKAVILLAMTTQTEETYRDEVFSTLRSLFYLARNDCLGSLSKSERSRFQEAICSLTHCEGLGTKLTSHNPFSVNVISYFGEFAALGLLKDLSQKNLNSLQEFICVVLRQSTCWADDAEALVAILKGVGQLARYGSLRGLSKNLAAEISSLSSKLIKDNPTLEQCCHALLGIGDIACLDLLKEDAQDQFLCFYDFKKNMFALVQKLEDKDLNAKQCADILYSVGRLIEKECMDRYREREKPLRRVVCNLVSSLTKKDPDSGQCCNAIQGVKLMYEKTLKHMKREKRLLLHEDVQRLFLIFGRKEPKVWERMIVRTCLEPLKKLLIEDGPNVGDEF